MADERKSIRPSQSLPVLEAVRIAKRLSIPRGDSIKAIETTSTPEAKLSARGVCHRTSAHFEGLVKSSTWVLKNALSSEVGRPVREAHVRIGRAYAYYRLGQYKQALQDFTSCIDIDPAWALAYFDRGCTYYHMGKLDRAIQDITKAIKFDPKNKTYLDSRAMLYREHGHFREAIADYNRIEGLKIVPPDETIFGLEAAVATHNITQRRPVAKSLHDELDPRIMSVFRYKPKERPEATILSGYQIAKSWRVFERESQNVIVDFLQVGRLESYAARSYIFRQGDDAAHYYIIMAGSVVVTTESIENGQVKTQKLCSLFEGDGFGEPREFHGPRRASVLTSDTVHCLVVSHQFYQNIMERHVQSQLEEKCAVLRKCRVFDSCTDEVLQRVAQMSSLLMFQPYRTVMKAGDMVDKLYVIKRGVCTVKKLLPIDAKHGESASREGKRSSVKRTKVPECYDGSWAVDNGWQLTNPRLRSEFAPEGRGAIEVTIATLSTGQVFGEVCVLRHNQSSTISVTSDTLLEVLELNQNGLAQLNLKFNSRTMNALQNSFLYHNPPHPKMAHLFGEQLSWRQEKSRIVLDVLEDSPGNGVVKRATLGRHSALDPSTFYIN
ncbi:hypothetical protein SPRG_08144 [Saprolegnia parasitica CBS 223.65]|uniref:Cyclic nucleotide-binding domain-containing protein n=1 Tax=Saprolegnia parasitica (strain CBS 223.65) TaxID=695850 RepID=A0A067C7W0_SAPPC|nr:hypothetical protein SPRG_08144 [Saprolegnia parasitica CBS 223.65]KDO26854.1 hypothetical protein SPRG_08144 [Saprolegnia parasitica CBS 223.65]|eukprot:XP_012202499.1 hypothetical protein SPRG_08144 [Saprolegnia parasitica CBS 223.65]